MGRAAKNLIHRKDGFKRTVDNKMRSFGETDLERKTIRINKKKNKKAGKGELLDTIVHEELHRVHSRMKEKNIKKEATRRISTMRQTTKSKLFNKFNG